MDKLIGLVPPVVSGRLSELRGVVTEIRLRAGGKVQLVCSDRDVFVGEALTTEALRRILSALMEHSLYTRESELATGFFTMEDGSRVGVCGRRYQTQDGYRLGEIGSACIRIARPVRGCACDLLKAITEERRVHSALLLSPPGLGKTTMLRDAARLLSERGYNVGVADERHELAACCQGVPTMELGPRTDVMDGCPKQEAIRQLLRSMAPDVIVADEISGKQDARALADATRCGVPVVASAHADSLESAALRPSLRAVLESGAMELAVILGKRPDNIEKIVPIEVIERGDGAWRLE